MLCASGVGSEGMACSARVSAASEFFVQLVRSARSDGSNVHALRALEAIVGKREGRRAKVNLAPRAGKITFARERLMR